MTKCQQGHAHRTAKAAENCDVRVRAYQESNPANPLYVPLNQRTVTVAQQLPAPKIRRR